MDKVHYFKEVQKKYIEYKKKCDSYDIIASKLLRNPFIFNNLKAEWFEEFIDNYPVDWAKISYSSELNAELINKYGKHLKITAIVKKHFSKLDEETKLVFANKLGVENKIRLGLIDEAEIMKLYSNGSKTRRRKIERAVGDMKEHFGDGLELWFLMI